MSEECYDGMSKAKALSSKWLKQAYPHQASWFADRKMPYRNLLLDRQVGATMAMGIEAAIVGLETGRKQVFIATTVVQAEIFKHYAIEFFGEAILQQVVFQCVSPKVFLRRDMSADFDVYIDGYLWMKSDDLEVLHRFFLTRKPSRVTWLTDRHPGIKYQILERVTYREDGTFINPLLSK